MIGLLLLWIVLFVALVVFAIGRPREGGALTLAYFLGLSLIHVPAALIYVNPTSFLPYPDETELGFEMTIVSLAAYVLGASLMRLIHRRKRSGFAELSPDQRRRLRRFGSRMIVIGALSYFVVLPVAGNVSSLTAVVSPLASLLLLGICVHLYVAVVAHERLKVFGLLASVPILPISTLVTGGFIGFGINWALSVISFLFVIVRQRRWFFLLSPFVAYAGLSLFVTYMGERTGIRDVIWNAQSDFADRFERASSIVTNFQWLDLGNATHLDAIDGRLNQNFLVGAMVQRHQEGVLELAYGGTVALWALVPRAIWPEKPDVGGGGALVADLTGLTFAEGTSVGTGQVMEFYANFGWIGILIGFSALGALLMQLDRGIMRALSAGDFRGLTLRAMPGFVLLQPGGNLLEILVAVVGAIVTSHLVVIFERQKALRERSLTQHA
jgi:hypothetical protein